MQPSFETERLLIRPRCPDHLEACLAMDQDPEVTGHVPGPWDDPAANRAFIVERMGASYPAGMGYWSLLLRPDPHAFLGWVLLLPYRDFGEEIEIGWRLRRQVWGRGLATEAASAVLRHAFETLGLESVVADIHATNLASQRVAEKLGMQVAESRTIAGLPAKSYRIERPSP